MEINGKHIMFRANALIIEPFEVVKTTAHSVTYKQERFAMDLNAPKKYVNQNQRKVSDFHFWAETFEECKQWLIDYIQNKIDRAESEIKRQKDYMDRVKRLSFSYKS